MHMHVQADFTPRSEEQQVLVLVESAVPERERLVAVAKARTSIVQHSANSEPITGAAKFATLMEAQGHASQEPRFRGVTRVEAGYAATFTGEFKDETVKLGTFASAAAAAAAWRHYNLHRQRDQAISVGRRVGSMEATK